MSATHVPQCAETSSHTREAIQAANNVPHSSFTLIVASGKRNTLAATWECFVTLYNWLSHPIVHPYAGGNAPQRAARRTTK